MTGQIIIEFDGRKVPDIKMKGEILPININGVDRFLRRAYRIHLYKLHKENKQMKKEVGGAAKEPKGEEFTQIEPMPAEYAGIPMVPEPVGNNEFPVLGGEPGTETSREISENKGEEDDKRGTAEDARGSGSSNGTKEEL